MTYSRGLSFLSVILILSFVCLPAWSAAGTLDRARLIEGVPFHEQEENQCGPASLAAVMNYYGVKVEPSEIAQSIYSPSARGTLDLDMVIYAGKKGFSARQYRGSIEDLKKNIENNNPLIILVDYGFFVYQRNHYMVVVGYTGEGIIVNSGKEKMKFISSSDFDGPWEKTRYWTLLITPKGSK